MNRIIAMVFVALAVASVDARATVTIITKPDARELDQTCDENHGGTVQMIDRSQHIHDVQCADIASEVRQGEWHLPTTDDYGATYTRDARALEPTVSNGGIDYGGLGVREKIAIWSGVGLVALLFGSLLWMGADESTKQWWRTKWNGK